MDSRTRMARGRRAAAIAARMLRGNGRVSLVDVGNQITGGNVTGNLAVRVHLVDKHAPLAEARIEALTGPEFIDKSNIPFDTVDIIEGAYPIETGLPSGRFNPLIGGISASNQYAWGYGTLGCGVNDRASGAPMVLSNWHVFVASIYLPPTARAHQPGLGDDAAAPAIGTMARHALWRGFDAAVAVLDDDRQYLNDQRGLGPLAGLVPPSLGMRVLKSGRGSGVTSGAVDGVHGSYFASVAGLPLVIREVVRIVPDSGPEVSRPGDSGSIWMDLDRKATGLHFAGGDLPETALAMDLTAVLESLEVDLDLLGTSRALPAASLPI